MLSKLRIRMNVLLASMLLLISLTGCSATKVILHPIKDTDFYIRDTGEVDEEGKPVEDVCMSEFYFTEVLKAKIEVQ